MVGFEDGNRITLSHLQLKTVLYVIQKLCVVKRGIFSNNVWTDVLRDVDRILVTF